MTSPRQGSPGRIRACFNRSAPFHKRHTRAQVPIGEALIDALCHHTDGGAVERALDVGCGQSALFAQLSSRLSISTCLGVDLAERLLVQGRDNFREDCQTAGGQAPKSHWIQADAHCLPLRDSSVDLLCSSMALHWCANAERAVAEMSRVLREDALMAIAVPVFPTMERLRKRLADLGIAAGINAFWHPAQWQDLLGMEPVSFQYFHYPIECAGTAEALEHIKGVGANCLWQRLEANGDSETAATPAPALGQWRRARGQKLWAEPVELCFHIGLWVLRNTTAR